MANCTKPNGGHDIIQTSSCSFPGLFHPEGTWGHHLRNWQWALHHSLGTWILIKCSLAIGIPRYSHLALLGPSHWHPTGTGRHTNDRWATNFVSILTGSCYPGFQTRESFPVPSGDAAARDWTFCLQRCPCTPRPPLGELQIPGRQCNPTLPITLMLRHSSQAFLAREPPGL